MAAVHMKSSKGFSSIILYTILTLILISIFPSTPRRRRHEGVNNYRLQGDDYRIAKALMDRCVEIFLNPSSPPPQNLREDEIEVQHLDSRRCNMFFGIVGSSISKNGRFKLSDYINRPSEYRVIWGSNPPDHKNGGITDEDRRILKPMLQECVNLYLDGPAYADGDWETKESDICYCKGYLMYLHLYLGDYYGNFGKLIPEYLDIMKEYPKFYTLDWDEDQFRACLIEENHGNGNCNGLREWRRSNGFSDVVGRSENHHFVCSYPFAPLHLLYSEHS